MNMVKGFIASLLFLAALSLSAQNTEERKIGSFDKIDVFGNITVEMKQGDAESLKIETKSIDPKEVITKIEDKLLKIKLSSNLFEDDVKVKIFITYKDLREISSNGSALVDILDEIVTDKVFANATSGGRIKMKVKLNAVELKAYQGANIDITGSAKLQESFVNTGGVLSASNFECDEVFIKMNTGGQAEVIANHRIEANVNTGAKLSFFGKPEKQQLKTSLGGKISKWDEN